MENWMIAIASLLGGLGIGSLLTTLLKENFEAKKLILREKLQAYSCYLEAFQENIAKNSIEKTRQRVVYWHKRIELVAPENICSICQSMYSCPPNETAALRDKLVEEMRKDLQF